MYFIVSYENSDANLNRLFYFDFDYFFLGYNIIFRGMVFFIEFSFIGNCILDFDIK